jgi:hypothetical protein
MVESIDSSSGSDDDGYEVPPWRGKGSQRQHSHQKGSSKQQIMSSSPSGGRYEKQSNGTNIDSAEGGSPGSGDGDVEGRGFDEEFDITGQIEPPRYINERKCLGVFSWRVFVENMWNPLDWEVLMLTLASGSDHVVIYNAMLEDETSVTQILISIAVYYIMLVVHVVAAIALIRCKFIAKLFQTYSILLIIFLLIGTGVYILKDSVLFCNC